MLWTLSVTDLKVFRTHWIKVHIKSKRKRLLILSIDCLESNLHGCEHTHTHTHTHTQTTCTLSLFHSHTHPLLSPLLPHTPHKVNLHQWRKVNEVTDDIQLVQTARLGFRAPTAWTKKLLLILLVRPVSVLYLLPDGKSWNRPWAGWDWSAIICFDLATVCLRYISSNEGSLHPMIRPAIFTT